MVTNETAEARIRRLVQKMERFVSDIQNVSRKLQNAKANSTSKHDFNFHSYLQNEIVSWNITGIMKQMQNQVYEISKHQSADEQVIFLKPIIDKLNTMMSKVTELQIDTSPVNNVSTDVQSSVYIDDPYNFGTEVFKKHQIIKDHEDETNPGKHRDEQVNEMIQDLKMKFNDLLLNVNNTLKKQETEITGFKDTVNRIYKLNVKHVVNDAKKNNNTTSANNESILRTISDVNPNHLCKHSTPKLGFTLLNGLENSISFHKKKVKNMSECIKSCCMDLSCDIALLRKE